MGRSINQVTLLGNVGNDPDVKTVQTQKGPNTVAKLSLATSSFGGDKEKTDWHRLEAWGNVGAIIGQYVKKGDRLAVTGSVSYDSYEKDGVKTYTTTIKVRDVVLLSDGKERTASAEPASSGEYEGPLPELPF